jgi:hypothetical protein
MSSRTNLHEIGPKFENFLKRNELRPADRFKYRGFEVFIGEGGPYHLPNPEFPDGWFEAVYMLIYRDPSTGKRITGFQPMSFAINHDLTMSDRRQARIEFARAAAKTHIDEFHKQWQKKSSTLVTLH